MNELNKKLIERAGFKSATRDSFLRGWFKYPDGSIKGELPDFTDPMWGIAHCFKWLVPNKEVSIVGVAFRYYPGGTEAIVTVQDEAGFTEYKGWVENEEPQEYTYKTYEKSALALCLAIEKLIDGSEK